MSRIIKYIEQAERLVGLEMPEPALTEIRKALEGVCNDVIKRENFTVEGKNPQLEQKMQEIFCRVKAKELSIPKSLSLDMMHIQRIGNHASHDQGEEIPISIGSASAALIQVKELAKWYFSNYGLNEPAAKKKNKEAYELNKYWKTIFLKSPNLRMGKPGRTFIIPKKHFTVDRSLAFITT